MDEEDAFSDDSTDTITDWSTTQQDQSLDDDADSERQCGDEGTPRGTTNIKEEGGPQGPERCPICEKSFESKAALDSHTTSFHLFNNYRCKECGALFQTAKSLKMHTSVHTQDFPYKCPSCPEAFMSVNRLNVHLAAAHGRYKRYKCRLCEKSFEAKVSLVYHERVHTGEQPYDCAICFKTFKTPGQLSSHASRVHYKLRPHKCDVCGKGFAQHVDMRRHRRVHAGESRHQCMFCSQAFPRLSEFNHHVDVVHGKQLWVQCKFCDKRFDSKQHCKRHEKYFHLRHLITSEKKKLPAGAAEMYKCPLCQRSFAKRCSVKVHISSFHHKLKPHKCTDCDKCFTTRECLTRHQRRLHQPKPRVAKKLKCGREDSNTVAKKPQCPLCGKSFSELRNVKVHVATVHHKVKNYECQDCGKRFGVASNLKKHRVLHQPNQSRAENAAMGKL